MEKGENTRSEEAKKVTQEIEDANQLEELEEMLKKNYIEWNLDGVVYRVRKPNFAEKQELREIKVKKEEFNKFLNFLEIDFYDWIRENLRSYFVSKDK